MIAPDESLRDALKQDALWFKCDLKLINLTRAMLLHPGFRIVVVSRVLGEYRVRRKMRFLTIPLVVLHHILRELSGIQISYGMKAGGGFYMPHFGSIIINQDATFGRNCYISHNITVGKVHAGEKMGVPSFGDDVYVGPGAVILGACRIGNNVAIAANSVVMSDIPDDSFVAGAPAKVVSDKGSKEILGRADSV
ncbi:MAG: serine acetyltransferase [Verrucomicrobiota bacterium]